MELLVLRTSVDLDWLCGGLLGEGILDYRPGSDTKERGSARLSLMLYNSLNNDICFEQRHVRMRYEEEYLEESMR